MHPGSLSARNRIALQTVYLPLTRASTPSERLCKIARTLRAPPQDAKTLTPVIRHQPSGRAMRAVFVAAAFVSVLIAAVPTASAAPSCGRQVIDDWYDDGRIDGTYAYHCYDDAIEILPRDVRDYSSAKEDIQRALQRKLRGVKEPPATTDPSPADPTTTDPTDTTGIPPSDGLGDPPTDTIANPPVGESASSVPLPLLILAGLALLLVAGGSAGYLIRRFQSRRMPPPTA
jgi:hypothetical protein